jgi:hypothetical protein
MGWITMKHRLTLTSAALFVSLSLPALGQTETQAAPQPVAQQAAHGEQGVSVEAPQAASELGAPSTEAPRVEAVNTDVGEAAPVESRPAPKGVRQYAVAALAALGVVLFSMFVLALVRGRRRRLAELANPGRPIDISKRHIILSREMPRDEVAHDEVEDSALPEAPPPASIRTPIVPSSPVVAESRTPTVPPSQPRPASKPQGDLAAAMLRATAQPPPFAPAPPPPASQRQWLSQRPAAMVAKER